MVQGRLFGIYSPSLSNWSVCGVIGGEIGGKSQGNMEKYITEKWMRTQEITKGEIQGRLFGIYSPSLSNWSSYGAIGGEIREIVKGCKEMMQVSRIKVAVHELELKECKEIR
jgi:hypothetical protein